MDAPIRSAATVAQAPEPSSTGQADLDRPLSPEGLAEAEAAGRWLAEKGLVPDCVLCSPARRTVRVASQEIPTATPPKPQLKARKKAWIGRSHQRSRCVGSCGLSSSAHIAGDNVSETMSEMTVAPAIASANCSRS